jgi:succinyl-diaminopimelate desuccinylase
MAPTADSLRQRVTELTADLVEYPTVASDPGVVDDCMDRVAAFFADAGIPVRRHRHEGVPSLVATPGETSDPDVLFHGHLDVVPAPERLFDPRVEGGRLYGRGTADMKGGLAAMMHVLRDVAADGGESVGMMVVADEERGGRHGVQYLLEEVGYRPAFCVTGEPNNLDGYLDIVTEQKGVVQVEVTATGAAAHAATPEQGENAIETLLAAYPDIRAAVDAEGDGEWTTTVNFGRIRGGDALNQVPDSATLELDIRYPDAASRDEVLFRLRQIPGVEVHSLGHGDPVATDPGEPHARALRNHARAVVGPEADFARKPHTSDLRHFARHGIPGVAFGPEGYGSHESFEHLVLDSLADYQRTLSRFAAGAPYV